MSFEMLVSGERLSTVCAKNHLGVWIGRVVLEKVRREMLFDTTVVDRDLVRAVRGDCAVPSFRKRTMP